MAPGCFFWKGKMAIDKSTYERISAHAGMFHNSTNIGVIEGSDGLYVIDTACSNDDGKCIVESLEDIFPHKKIKAVINTHSHADHCGGNAYIVKTQNAQIWAPRNESKIMEFPRSLGVMYWGGIPFSDINNPVFVVPEALEVTKTFSDTSVDVGTATISFVPLPGHFFDQSGIFVYDKEDGLTTAYLGDGFFGMSLLKKFWIPFMYEPEKFRSSVLKIESSGADYFVPGHGELYTKDNITAAAEMNTMVTLETEFLILRLLEEKPMTQEELLKAVTDYAGITMRPVQFVLIGTTLRSYLSSLLNRGKVSFEMCENRMLWRTVR